MPPDVVLNSPTRNLYFYGLLMDAERFQRDQDHCNAQRRLLNRYVTGAGVVCGLALNFDAAKNALTLSSGVALDRIGREIIVSDQTTIDITQLTDMLGNPTGPVPAGSTLLISIAYAEKDIDPVAVLVPDCEHPGRCATSVIEETFAIVVTVASTSVPTPSPCVFGSFPFSYPPGTALQTVIANSIAAGVGSTPADTSVPLGRLTSGGPLDAVSDRLLVYDNLLLFQLISCLAARVEQVSGTALVYVSGDGQSAKAGAGLANPLVVAFLDSSGNPVTSAGPPSFSVTSGGGSIGAVTSAGPGEFQVTWTLGSTGPQVVTAQKSHGRL